MDLEPRKFETRARFSARMANARKTLPLARKLARRSAALRALLEGS
jgi:hypothetical protein